MWQRPIREKQCCFGRWNNHPSAGTAAGMGPYVLGGLEIYDTPGHHGGLCATRGRGSWPTIGRLSPQNPRGASEAETMKTRRPGSWQSRFPRQSRRGGDCGGGGHAAQRLADDGAEDEAIRGGVRTVRCPEACGGAEFVHGGVASGVGGDWFAGGTIGGGADDDVCGDGGSGPGISMRNRSSWIAGARISISIPWMRMEDCRGPATRGGGRRDHPVDYGGQIGDMDAILRLAAREKLTVIEDAAHCCPAHYRKDAGTLWLPGAPRRR